MTRRDATNRMWVDLSDQAGDETVDAILERWTEAAVE
jgi:hypothetical protein